MPEDPSAGRARRRRSPDTRQSILAAATAAFAANGYAGTAIADVAVTAGTSTGLIYYHFESKEGLFSAIWHLYQREQEERIGIAIQAAKEAGVSDPVELLACSVEAYFRGAWERRAVVRAAHVNDTPPAFKDDRAAANERWMQRNRALVEQGDQGMAEEVLVGLLGAVGALCARLADCEDDEAAEQLVRRAMRVVRSIVATLESTGHADRVVRSPT